MEANAPSPKEVSYLVSDAKEAFCYLWPGKEPEIFRYAAFGEVARGISRTTTPLSRCNRA